MSFKLFFNNLYCKQFCKLNFKSGFSQKFPYPLICILFDPQECMAYPWQLLRKLFSATRCAWRIILNDAFIFGTHSFSRCVDLGDLFIHYVRIFHKQKSHYIFIIKIAQYQLCIKNEKLMASIARCCQGYD